MYSHQKVRRKRRKPPNNTSRALRPGNLELVAAQGRDRRKQEVVAEGGRVEGDRLGGRKRLKKTEARKTPVGDLGPKPREETEVDVGTGATLCTMYILWLFNYNYQRLANPS